MKNFHSVQNALEYIDRNLSEPINFETLAEELHFSPFYFHRLFSMITGKSIAAYIRGRRLERACIELCGTRKTITEICFAYGFNSQASFSRAFRKKYGIPPHEYRRQKHTPTIQSIDEMLLNFEKLLETSDDMNKKIRSGIEKITQQLTLDTKNAALYNERGELYHAIKQHGDAKSDFMKAVSLEPLNSHYLMNLGNTYQWLGEFAEAVIHQSKAIENLSDDSKKVWYYYNRGNSYQWLGYHAINRESNYKNAVADYSKAIEYSPDNYTYFGERGVCFHSLGKYREAICDYTEAFCLNPSEAVYLAYRGLAYSETGEYEKALCDFNLTIETDSTQGRFYNFRADNFCRMRRNSEALADYKTAIKLDPTNFCPKPEIILGLDFINSETDAFINALTEKITELRLDIKTEHGFEIPPIKISDSSNIDELNICIFVSDISVWHRGDLLAETVENRADIIVSALRRVLCL